RPFRLPGGDTLPFLGFLAANLIVFWTGWDTNWKLFLAMALGYVVLGLHYAFSDRSMIPPLQFKSGWCMILSLGGLAVLSLLSNYGEGSLGLLTCGSFELACFIVTAIVFAVSVGTRLKSNEVTTNVENTKQSSAETIDGE